MLKMEMDKGINKTTSKEISNGEKQKAKENTQRKSAFNKFSDFNMYVTTHKYENEYFVI